MTTLENQPAQESTAPTGALAVLAFVLCLALFAGGLWVMAIGYDQASGLLFSVGLIASGLAFLVPLELLPRMD